MTKLREATDSGECTPAAARLPKWSDGGGDARPCRIQRPRTKKPGAGDTVHYDEGSKDPSQRTANPAAARASFAVLKSDHLSLLNAPAALAMALR